MKRLSISIIMLILTVAFLLFAQDALNKLTEKRVIISLPNL